MVQSTEKTRIAVSSVSAAGSGGAVLNDISFTAEPGTVTAVMAEPAEGAILLLDCMGGAMVPEAGRIELDGADVGVAVRDGRVCLIRGAAQFPPALTVGEFYAQMGRLLGDGAGADAALSVSEFGDLRNRFAAELPAEARQLLRLAASTIGDPAAVLVEKVDRDLTPPARRLAYRFIKQHRERGAAVLFTSENMEATESLSNQVLVLKDGRVAACDTPENLILAGDRWMRVEVFTSDELEMDTLAGEEYVNRIVRHGNRFDIFVPNEFASVRRLLSWFDAEKIEIRDLRTYRSTLSDVVWELT